MTCPGRQQVRTAGSASCTGLAISAIAIRARSAVARSPRRRACCTSEKPPRQVNQLLIQQVRSCKATFDRYGGEVLWPVVGIDKPRHVMHSSFTDIRLPRGVMPRLSGLRSTVERDATPSGLLRIRPERFSAD